MADSASVQAPGAAVPPATSPLVEAGRGGVPIYSDVSVAGTLVGREVEVMAEGEMEIDEDNTLSPDRGEQADDGPQPPAPMIWVPGFTSTPLEAYYNSSRGPVKNRWCSGILPKDQWYTLYLSTTLAARSLPCYMWQMQLQPPEEPGGCVRDAEGLEIREVGFGSTAGASAINPSDPITFKLYEPMIAEFEKVGLVRDETIRFATYDWRKFGDRCWEREWYPRFRRLIEETANSSKRPVSLGCHSMGCLLVWAFLVSEYVDPVWKRTYVQDFMAFGPVFAGSSMLLLTFIQGPSYDFLPLMVSHFGRDVATSMPATYTLFPVKDIEGWDENLTLIETPWRNYTIDSVYDGSFYNDVEGPIGLDENVNPVSGASSIGGGELAQGAKEDAAVFTEQGCICTSSCGHPGQEWSRIIDVASFLDGLPRVLGKRLQKTYCTTLGGCGHWDMMSGFWDYCSIEAKPSDAGPGFEFFPAVDVAEGEKYQLIATLQLEELKERCLADARCTAFSTDGWLIEGPTKPGKSWRGVTKGERVAPGLYIKRASILQCQADLEPVPSSDASMASAASSASFGEAAVCGTDGRTYPSDHHLELARCWRQPRPEKEHDGVCASMLTVQGCRCEHPCSFEPGNEREKTVTFGWCFTKDGCGNIMPDPDAGSLPDVMPRAWDFCTNDAIRKRLDTGRGFQYVPRTKLKITWTLHPVSKDRPLSLEAMQVVCGEDPNCAGFTNEGDMLPVSDWTRLGGDEGRYDYADFGAGDLGSLFEDTRDPASGIYLKMERVKECQRLAPLCSEAAKRTEQFAVCVLESRRTFKSQCDAEAALCYSDALRSPLDVGTASTAALFEVSSAAAAAAAAAEAVRNAPSERYISGPCKRPMRTNLHEFAMDWVRRVSRFEAPGVPTTCIYIDDVPTDASWYVEDFLEKGRTRAQLPGDGTVTAKSVAGPCELWRRSQSAPVRILPQRFKGRVAHVAMLQSKPCLATLMRFMKEPWPEAEPWAASAKSSLQVALTRPRATLSRLVSVPMGLDQAADGPKILKHATSMPTALDHFNVRNATDGKLALPPAVTEALASPQAAEGANATEGEAPLPPAPPPTALLDPAAQLATIAEAAAKAAPMVAALARAASEAAPALDALARAASAAAAAPSMAASTAGVALAPARSAAGALAGAARAALDVFPSSAAAASQLPVADTAEEPTGGEH